MIDAIDAVINDSLNDITHIGSYFLQFTLKDIDNAQDALLHATSATDSVHIEIDIVTRASTVTDLYMSMLLTCIVNALIDKRIMTESFAKAYVNQDPDFKKRLNGILSSFYDPIDARLISLMHDFSLQCVHGINKA